MHQNKNLIKEYNNINSPEDFINKIEDEIDLKTNNSNDDNDDSIYELTEDLNLFKSFSKEKQIKFIEMLNDENIIFEMIENLTENFEEISTEEDKIIKINDYLL